MRIECISFLIGLCTISIRHSMFDVPDIIDLSCIEKVFNKHFENCIHSIWMAYDKQYNRAFLCLSSNLIISNATTKLTISTWTDTPLDVRSFFVNSLSNGANKSGICMIRGEQGRWKKENRIRKKLNSLSKFPSQTSYIPIWCISFPNLRFISCIVNRKYSYILFSVQSKHKIK